MMPGSAPGRNPGTSPEQTPVPTMTVPTARTVVGDGSTAASTARGRWRRSRTTAIVIALLVVVAALSVLPRPRTSGIPLAPDNPSAAGGRAVARILAFVFSLRRRGSAAGLHHTRSTPEHEVAGLAKRRGRRNPAAARAGR